jgi:hypothetical protein
LPEDNGRASDLWRALVGIVDAAKTTAGSVDRTQLIERLTSNFHLAPMRQWLPAIEKLREVSARAIDDIKTDIGGVHLFRRELFEELDGYLNTDHFIEVVGEAGSGKSALLKELATRKGGEGPVLFLKASRLPNDVAGWEGLASLWQLDISLNELIAELIRPLWRSKFAINADEYSNWRTEEIRILGKLAPTSFFIFSRYTYRGIQILTDLKATGPKGLP